MITIVQREQVEQIVQLPPSTIRQSGRAVIRNSPWFTQKRMNAAAGLTEGADRITAVIGSG